MIAVAIIKTGIAAKITYKVKIKVKSIWKLFTIQVILAAMPVLIIAAAIIAGSKTALTEKEMAAYGHAGGIDEEVLSSIRTIVAFEA